MIVPMNAPEHFSTVATDDDLGEAVVTAVGAFLPIGAGVDYPPADQLFLHSKENLSRNNRFVITFHIVLWDQTVVLDAGLIQKICGVGLLQQSISDVLLVPENFIDGAGVPFRFPGTGKNAISLQPGSNFVHAVAVKVLAVNAFDHLGLFRINDQIAFGVFCIAEKAIVVNLHLSVLVSELQSQLDIL